MALKGWMEERVAMLISIRMILYERLAIFRSDYESYDMEGRNQAIFL